LPLAYTVHLGIYSPPPIPGTGPTPPLEVATQIRQVLCFFFDAFFGSSADEVRLYSAASPSLPHVFATNRTGDRASAKAFPGFLRKLLRLNRKAYVAVQRCMAAHEHALLSLLHHPELAYSLLVFALESLVQEFDGFAPQWSDLRNSYRKKLDDILTKVDSSASDALRNAIVENQHLRLEQRVLTFVSRHISGSYFAALGGPPAPRVRRSTFKLALKGAYDLRSRYAHALMRSEDIRRESEIVNIYDAEGECQVAFTIRGLQRLFREVVIRFIEEQPESDGPFEYEASVERPPGAYIIYSPEYWLKNVQGLTVETARAYFEGLLYSYDCRILKRDSVPMSLGVGANGVHVLSFLRDSPPDLESLGRRATELQSGKMSKQQEYLLTAIQILCGSTESFRAGHEPKCTPEILAATIARAWTPAWEIEQIDHTVTSLLLRSSEGTSFPDLMEICIIFYVSFAWQKSGNQEKAMAWLKRSWEEASSWPKLQVAIEHGWATGQAIDRAPSEAWRRRKQGEQKPSV
jgi:hypothetical protein